MVKICVWTCVTSCDMTSRSYFGKMNSTLGSVVPLAIFHHSSQFYVHFTYRTLEVRNRMWNMSLLNILMSLWDWNDKHSFSTFWHVLWEWNNKYYISLSLFVEVVPLTLETEVLSAKAFHLTGTLSKYILIFFYFHSW